VAVGQAWLQRRFGVDPSTAGDWMDEALEALKALWSAVRGSRAAVNRPTFVAETVEGARVEGGDAMRGVLESYARRGQLHARLDRLDPESPLDPMPLDASRAYFLWRAADHLPPDVVARTVGLLGREVLPYVS
jgi:hypothetical protein